MLKLFLAGLAISMATLTVGCSGPAPSQAAETSLEGAILNPSTGDRLSFEDVLEEARAARFVMLGEKHDNPAHHRMQARILEGIAADGRKPAVVWEMIPFSKEAVLAAYLSGDSATPAGLGAALNWDASGWPDWVFYQPIAKVAMDAGLKQYAGNIDSAYVRSVAREGFSGLPDPTSRTLASKARWTENDETALNADLVDSHCGFMPDGMLGPMNSVQRGRDAVMAASLLEADVGDGAVLIAGNGHVRADRGVPRYLEPERNVLSIGLIEAVDGETDPMAYLEAVDQFDIVIFTSRVETPDRCAELEKRFGKQN
ncbi:ChaN family lipoprotein [Minwuia sp.]|uniref:ChaN family lipoprotein n=1 Tax=Minwuia sp. TaxID=2493630 RepID=UPI003A90B624